MIKGKMLHHGEHGDTAKGLASTSEILHGHHRPWFRRVAVFAVVQRGPSE